MPEIILGLVIVLLILGFALYGFIRFLMFLFGNRNSQPAPQFQFDRKLARSLGDDVLATSHLLNYLFLKKRIDDKTYRRMRGFLETEFAVEHELSKPVVGSKDSLPTPLGQPKTVIDDRGELREVSGSDVELRESPPISSRTCSGSGTSSCLATDVDPQRFYRKSRQRNRNCACRRSTRCTKPTGTLGYSRSTCTRTETIVQRNHGRLYAGKEHSLGRTGKRNLDCGERRRPGRQFARRVARHDSLFFSVVVSVNYCGHPRIGDLHAEEMEAANDESWNAVDRPPVNSTQHSGCLYSFGK